MAGFAIENAGWGGGRHRMARPLSMDRRERVVAAALAGESCRSVAARFDVAVSSVVKWSQRHCATGSAALGKMGVRCREEPVPQRALRSRRPKGTILPRDQTSRLMVRRSRFPHDRGSLLQAGVSALRGARLRSLFSSTSRSNRARKIFCSSLSNGFRRRACVRLTRCSFSFRSWAPAPVM